VTPDLLARLHELPPVGLVDLMDQAAALHRVDRKYLVPVGVAAALVTALSPRHAVLTIDARRHTTYRSTYLDTATLSSSRDHQQQRRRRWKARSRLYVEDGLCRTEVKVRSARGATLKVYADSTPARYGRCGDHEVGFVHATLADHGFAAPPVLAPTLEVGYQRATLADLAAGSRITLDTGVVGTDGGSRMLLDPAFVVVETKGGPRPGVADRILLAGGHRPQSFSKYVATASLLRSDLPSNDVRRLVGVALHVESVSPHEESHAS
jgi:hypothetical protein